MAGLIPSAKRWATFISSADADEGQPDFWKQTQWSALSSNIATGWARPRETASTNAD